MADRIVTWQEFEKHIYSYDCWVLVDGCVYNVNDYLVEHPGGDDILVRFSGTDGTTTFKEVPHSDYAISLRNARLVGKIQSSEPPEGYLQRIAQKKSNELKNKNKSKAKILIREDKITWKEISLHNSQESCWIVLNGKVYDVTTYLEEHPGGVNKIMQFAGRDASKGFRQAKHSMQAIEISEKYYIGEVASNNIARLLAIVFVLLGVYLVFK